MVLDSFFRIFKCTAASFMPLWAAVWDLTTIPNPLNPEESLGALFIDPNADPDDPLPGGLLLKMQVSDVQASHVYENLSTENNVITSAMRITLDPFSAMLTIVPTAANYANVTIWGIDREHNKISATMMVTVVSGARCASTRTTCRTAPTYTALWRQTRPFAYLK